MGIITGDNIDKLLQSPLFIDIQSDNLRDILHCVGANKHYYCKGEWVLRKGTIVDKIGIVVKGCIYLMKEDFWGNRAIIETINPGYLFAESYSTVYPNNIEIDFVSAKESEVIFINTSKILNVCTSKCQFHQILMRNLFNMLANKNKQLIKKMNYLSNRNIQLKILSFLSDMAHIYDSNKFTIDFNRQELADYLYVDRSALSSELSKLHKKGMINYKKNYFELLKGNINDGD